MILVGIDQVGFDRVGVVSIPKKNRVRSDWFRSDRVINDWVRNDRGLEMIVNRLPYIRLYRKLFTKMTMSGKLNVLFIL